MKKKAYEYSKGNKWHLVCIVYYSVGSFGRLLIKYIFKESTTGGCGSGGRVGCLLIVRLVVWFLAEVPLGKSQNPKLLPMAS